MVELPISHEALTGLIPSLDGMLVTHTHRDHWDQAAVERGSERACPCRQTETPWHSTSSAEEVDGAPPWMAGP